MMGSLKMMDKGYINTENNKMQWCHIQLHISHKAAKSMAKLTSQTRGDLQLALWLSKEVGKTIQALVDI